MKLAKLFAENGAATLVSFLTARAGTEAVVAWIGGRIDLLCARQGRYVDLEE